MSRLKRALTALSTKLERAPVTLVTGSRGRGGVIFKWFSSKIGLIKRWGRTATQDPELRPNLLVLVFSTALMTAAVVAFLWLTGILEWRGSSGRTGLTLNLTCRPTDGDVGAEDCRKRIGYSDKIEAFLDFQPRYTQRDTLDLTIGRAPALPSQDLVSVLTNDVTLQVSADREFDIQSETSVDKDKSWHSADWWFSKPQARPNRVFLSFAPTSLLRFTGFSEREISLVFGLIQGGSVLHGRRQMDLSLRPPVGFDVVEASPSATRDSSGSTWTMSLTSDDGEFLFRMRMRNFEAARFDHILDSSISAVLGVAAGGLVTGLLGFASVRQRHRRKVNDDPSST